MHCSLLTFHMSQSYWQGHSPPLGCVPILLSAFPPLGMQFFVRSEVDSSKILSYCLLSQPILATDFVSSCFLDVDTKMEFGVQGT